MLADIGGMLADTDVCSVTAAIIRIKTAERR